MVRHLPPPSLSLALALALVLLLLTVEGVAGSGVRGGGIGANAVTASYAAGVWTIRGTAGRDGPGYDLDEDWFKIAHARLVGDYCQEHAVEEGTPCAAGLPVCRDRIGPYVLCRPMPITLIRFELAGGSDFLGGSEETIPTVIVAGEGHDEIDGDAGDDRIEGGPGNDAINDQDDRKPDTQDDDVIEGGPGRDQISTSGGHDRIDGGAGDDFITVAFGVPASVDAGPGNDHVNNFSSRAVIDCGPGRDIVNVRPGVRTRHCEVKR